LYRQVVALQEELDWFVYELFHLAKYTPASSKAMEDGLHPADRPAEQLLRHKLEAGETSIFYEVHVFRGAESEGKLGPEMNEIVRSRLRQIEDNPLLQLIETVNHKRRWQVATWEKRVVVACEAWFLDRLESYFDFDGRMNDEGKPAAKLDIALTSVARLTDVARQDPDFMRVGELYRDDPAFDVQRLVAELVEAESVPLLPVFRYKATGLRKRAEWEQTWELQREEDRTGKRLDIPVPPKYTSADFLNSDHWRLRGKLDVPKERWVSFPHCEGPDGTLVIAWAGYDHLQLARSISAYSVDIQERLGRRDDLRLVPLLACLLELLTWVKQCHNEPDAAFDGLRMGDYFEGFINEEARQLGKTVPEIKAWQPPPKTGGRSRKNGR